MSAFPESGRLDHRKSAEIKDRFRPPADVRSSHIQGQLILLRLLRQSPRALATSAQRKAIGTMRPRILLWANRCDFKLGRVFNIK
jgi:hypothetical protein